MADDIDTTTIEGFLAGFRPRAEAEIAQRMDAVGKALRRISRNGAALIVFRKLVAMDDNLRAITIGRTALDTRGARALDGTEAILGFVERYVLAQRECHAAPHVPDPDVAEVLARLSLTLSGGDRGQAEERHAAWLLDKARYAEIRNGPDGTGASLDPGSILELVERNGALWAEDASRHEAIDRRRRAILARIESRDEAG